MARKYRSMQEELEARKKAGVYGDLSQFEKRLFHDEPEWVKKSREDAERSKKISQSQPALTGYITDLLDRDSSSETYRQENADRRKSVRDGEGKWSLRGKRNAEKRISRDSSPGRTDAEKQAERDNLLGHLRTELEKRAAEVAETARTERRQTVKKTRKAASGKGRSYRIIFWLIIAITIISSIYNDLFPGSVDGDDWYGMYYSQDGEFDIYTSYTEAEQYIIQMYAGGAADGNIFLWVAENVTPVLDNPETDFVYPLTDEAYTDCYLMVWAECSETEDSDDVFSRWACFSEDVRQMLDDAGYEQVPVCVILKETEAWELRLVMVDNDILFTSGGF